MREDRAIFPALPFGSGEKRLRISFPSFCPRRPQLRHHGRADGIRKKRNNCRLTGGILRRFAARSSPSAAPEPAGWLALRLLSILCAGAPPSLNRAQGIKAAGSRAGKVEHRQWQPESRARRLEIGSRRRDEVAFQ